jgi:type IV pilus assembly protein PilB
MSSGYRATHAGTGKPGGKRMLLGDILVQKGLITDMKRKEALRLKASEDIPIGVALVRLGLVTEEDIAQALAEANGLEAVDPSTLEIQPGLSEAVPVTIMERYRIMPFEKHGDMLSVAVDRPLASQIIRNIERTARCRLRQHIAPTEKLLDAISFYFDTGPGLDAQNATAIEIVDEFIRRAIRMKASDIHLEPFEDRARLRFRVDGILQEMEVYTPELYPSILSRIKVMAELDIAEKRMPQDGAIVFQEERLSMDIRVSILPGIYGEKAVLRLLAGHGRQLKLSEIGLSEGDLETFDRLIHLPHGILLIVGPTGSGKSTTLSAALNTINDPGVNITTVEEPVEYKIDGITQIHIGGSDKIGFASALRSILRQDPDIIMVGEVRDAETAEIALRSAMTGHLVLTTLHTNDAASALPRLIDMGCEPFLIASSVSGILAQRLVRILCPRCREPYDPGPREAEALGLDPGDIQGPWYRSKGCAACMGIGYRGRTGVFELLEMDEKTRILVMEGGTAEQIKNHARKGSMGTLREDALQKVGSGITSLEELFRVTIRD